MKVCPKCKTQYTDDSLSFCLQDGTRLSEPQADHPTVSIEQGETLARRKDRDSEETHWRPSEVTRVAAIEPKRGSSSVPWAVAAAAIAVLLFGIAGLGAFVIYNALSGPSASVTNSNIAKPTVMASQTPTSVLATPTPLSSNVTPPIPNFPTPIPDSTSPTVDLETDQRDIPQRISKWKLATEERDINALMSNYADTVDYYKRSGVSSGVVRNDKQRAFSIFRSIRITISNVRIGLSTSGESAVAVFDKEWIFEGARTNSGKVQTGLRFRKIGGEWLITSERDLKVYYLNR